MQTVQVTMGEMHLKSVHTTHMEHLLMHKTKFEDTKLETDKAMAKRKEKKANRQIMIYKKRNIFYLT
jgi:hypothetical protein